VTSSIPGDKKRRRLAGMQETEVWPPYIADYGLTGRDGRLRFPFTKSTATTTVPGRWRRRHQLFATAIDGVPAAERLGKRLHYSWDMGWRPNHCLGIVVAPSRAPRDGVGTIPGNSLQFLVDDLTRNVGDTGKSCRHHAPRRVAR